MYCEKWSTFEGFWEDMSEGYSDSHEIDRIDADGGYNKENCRWVDIYTSRFNKGVYSNNKSGRTGVCKNKYGKWEVSIQCRLVNKYLGSFESFDEACLVRSQAEFECFGFTKS